MNGAVSAGRSESSEFFTVFVPSFLLLIGIQLGLYEPLSLAGCFYDPI